MPDLKLLRIEDGDSQKNFVDKINFNFSNTISFGGGPYGKIGPDGPQGKAGSVGPDGSYGDQGQRGNIWTVGPTQPLVADSTIGDFWVDTSNFNTVYILSSNGWEAYGFTMSSQDLFRTYGPLKTSAGTSSKSGYFITSQTPENYTLVLSDANFDSSPSGTSKYTFNPQYSKVVVSTNNIYEGRKIIEFTKAAYNNSKSFYSKTPGFIWTTGVTADRGEYGLTLSAQEGIFLDLPNSNLNLSSVTSGVNLISNGFNLNIPSGNSLLLASTNGNVVLDVTTAKTLTFSTSNLSYTNNKFIFSVRGGFYSRSSDSAPPIWLQSTVAGASNFRHKSSIGSSRSYSIFSAYDDTYITQIVADLKSTGEFYYNRRVNSLQPYQSPVNTSGDTVYTGAYPGSPSTVYWIPVLPTVSLVSAASSASVKSNTGVDFVIDPSYYNGDGSHDIGISLWTPAATGGGYLGWLNLVGTNESMTIRIRTSKPGQYFRYIGLNTDSNQDTGPTGAYGGVVGNGQFVDISGSTSRGASSVDLTIVNIEGTGATGATSRWFKVYYSAYAGNLGINVSSGYGKDTVKCGILYTYNSTPY